jgi:GH24 family phage-related lysozyme (muramidase)
LREGYQDDVYLDSRLKPTVGIGHLVLPEDNLRVGQWITDAQVSAFFEHDGASAMRAAVQQMDDAGLTSQAFLPYLASVCFQLGNAWTTKFPNTWKMICAGQYGAAAAALHGTAWNSQTPVRVADFQGALNRLPAKAKS